MAKPEAPKEKKIGEATACEGVCSPAAARESILTPARRRVGWRCSGGADSVACCSFFGKSGKARDRPGGRATQTQLRGRPRLDAGRTIPSEKLMQLRPWICQNVCADGAPLAARVEHANGGDARALPDMTGSPTLPVSEHRPHIGPHRATHDPTRARQTFSPNIFSGSAGGGKCFSLAIWANPFMRGAARWHLPDCGFERARPDEATSERYVCKSKPRRAASIQTIVRPSSDSAAAKLVLAGTQNQGDPW